MKLWASCEPLVLFPPSVDAQFLVNDRLRPFWWAVNVARASILIQLDVIALNCCRTSENGAHWAGWSLALNELIKSSGKPQHAVGRGASGGRHQRVRGQQFCMSSRCKYDWRHCLHVAVPCPTLDHYLTQRASKLKLELYWTNQSWWMSHWVN